MLRLLQQGIRCGRKQHYILRASIECIYVKVLNDSYENLLETDRD